MKAMTVKYKCTCKCGKLLRPGSTGCYDRANRKMYCPECAAGMQFAELASTTGRARAGYSGEDYECSDLGYEDACARACGFGL